MVNLFAFRTSEPSEMKAAIDLIGPDNDRWIAQLAGESELVIACWGNHGVYLGRSRQARKSIANLHYLALTQLGEPGNPLYLKKRLKPKRLNPVL